MALVLQWCKACGTSYLSTTLFNLICDKPGSSVLKSRQKWLHYNKTVNLPFKQKCPTGIVIKRQKEDVSRLVLQHFISLR